MVSCGHRQTRNRGSRERSLGVGPTSLGIKTSVSKTGLRILFLFFIRAHIRYLAVLLQDVETVSMAFTGCHLVRVR
jgi:hypothetical protein